MILVVARWIKIGVEAPGRDGRDAGAVAERARARSRKRSGKLFRILRVFFDPPHP